MGKLLFGEWVECLLSMDDNAETNFMWKDVLDWDDIIFETRKRMNNHTDIIVVLEWLKSISDSEKLEHMKAILLYQNNANILTIQSSRETNVDIIKLAITKERINMLIKAPIPVNIADRLAVGVFVLGCVFVLGYWCYQ